MKFHIMTSQSEFSINFENALSICSQRLYEHFKYSYFDTKTEGRRRNKSLGITKNSKRSHAF